MKKSSLLLLLLFLFSYVPICNGSTKQRLAYKSRGSLGVDLKSTVIL